MKIKIVINTRLAEQDGDNRSEIFNGELEINDENEYLTMISIIGEDKEHPICQIPFATGVGHYLWIPPDANYENYNRSPDVDWDDIEGLI